MIRNNLPTRKTKLSMQATIFHHRACLLPVEQLTEFIIISHPRNLAFTLTVDTNSCPLSKIPFHEAFDLHSYHSPPPDGGPPIEQDTLPLRHQCPILCTASEPGICLRDTECGIGRGAGGLWRQGKTPWDPTSRQAIVPRGAQNSSRSTA